MTKYSENRNNSVYKNYYKLVQVIQLPYLVCVAYSVLAHTAEKYLAPQLNGCSLTIHLMVFIPHMLSYSCHLSLHVLLHDIRLLQGQYRVLG